MAVLCYAGQSVRAASVLPWCRGDLPRCTLQPTSCHAGMRCVKGPHTRLATPGTPPPLQPTPGPCAGCWRCMARRCCLSPMLACKRVRQGWPKWVPWATGNAAARPGGFDGISISWRLASAARGRPQPNPCPPRPSQAPPRGCCATRTSRSSGWPALTPICLCCSRAASGGSLQWEAECPRGEAGQDCARGQRCSAARVPFSPAIPSCRPASLLFLQPGPGGAQGAHLEGGGCSGGGRGRCVLGRAAVWPHRRPLARRRGGQRMGLRRLALGVPAWATKHDLAQSLPARLPSCCTLRHAPSTHAMQCNAMRAGVVPDGTRGDLLEEVANLVGGGL